MSIYGMVWREHLFLVEQIKYGYSMCLSVYVPSAVSINTALLITSISVHILCIIICISFPPNLVIMSWLRILCVWLVHGIVFFSAFTYAVVCWLHILAVIILSICQFLYIIVKHCKKILNLTICTIQYFTVGPFVSFISMFHSLSQSHNVVLCNLFQHAMCSIFFHCLHYSCHCVKRSRWGFFFFTLVNSRCVLFSIGNFLPFENMKEIDIEREREPKTRMCVQSVW